VESQNNKNFLIYNPQSTFSEQVPAIIAKSARKTNRLKNALVAIAFESGGEAGAHLAKKLKSGNKPGYIIAINTELSGNENGHNPGHGNR